MWDLSSAKAPREFARDEGDFSYNYPAVAFSPDSRLLASTGTLDHSIELLDLTTGKLAHTLWGHQSSVEAVVFSPTGQLLASACLDGTIRLWSVTTGKLVRMLPGHTEGTYALAFTPDGRSLLSGGRDRAIRVWELATGTQRAEMVGHGGSVFGLAIMADGRTLASAGEDSSILLWDLPALRKANTPARDTLTEQELQQIWVDLTASDAAKADRAILRLTAAPKDSLRLLSTRLRPVPAVEAETLTQLLANLDHPRYSVRQKAEDSLLRLGSQAAPALREVLAGKPSLEVRRRVEKIREITERALMSGEELASWRAVEVLEHINKSPAQELLRKLATGAQGAHQTKAAAAALQRMKH